MNRQIPTEKDWETWRTDLDSSWACKQFSGKSIAAAVELFAENALYYQEDLLWMPKIPFQFYIQAYKAYLLSDRAVEDSDGASCYLRLIQRKLETDPEPVVEIFESITASIRYIAEHQAYYDADIAIYGDFMALYARICDLYANFSYGC